MTFDEEVDEVTGQSRMVVKDSPDEKKQPRFEIRSASNKVLKTYQMPVRANLMVNDGENVEPGDIIAKIPRETTKTKDITGGLPRVVELFEARRPAETAVMQATLMSAFHLEYLSYDREPTLQPNTPP